MASQSVCHMVVVWKYAGDSEGKVLLVGNKAKVHLLASFENDGKEFVHTFERPQILKMHPIFEERPLLFFKILLTTKPVLQLGKSTTVLHYFTGSLNFEISIPQKIHEGTSGMGKTKKTFYF